MQIELACQLLSKVEGGITNSRLVRLMDVPDNAKIIEIGHEFTGKRFEKSIGRSKEEAKVTQQAKISKTAQSLINSGDLYPVNCGQAHQSGAAFFRGRTYIAEWSPNGIKSRSVPGDKADMIRDMSRIRSQF